MRYKTGFLQAAAAMGVVELRSKLIVVI